MVAALPPLNQALARYQIIGALKNGKIREQASPVRLDIDALGQVLCQLSELLLAFPEIQELDLHPLQACGEEMVILDARLVLMEEGRQMLPLAIRPYPTELEEGAWLKDQSHVLLRRSDLRTNRPTSSSCSRSPMKTDTSASSPTWESWGTKSWPA